MRGGGIDISGTEAFILFTGGSCTLAGIKGTKSAEIGDLSTEVRRTELLQFTYYLW